MTPSIPIGEVDELRADAGDVSATGTRYKGRGNDAMRQERELDKALEQEGALGDEGRV